MRKLKKNPYIRINFFSQNEKKNSKGVKILATSIKTTCKLLKDFIFEVPINH